MLSPPPSAVQPLSRHTRLGEGTGICSPHIAAPSANIRASQAVTAARIARLSPFIIAHLSCLSAVWARLPYMTRGGAPVDMAKFRGRRVACLRSLGTGTCHVPLWRKSTTKHTALSTKLFGGPRGTRMPVRVGRALPSSLLQMTRTWAPIPWKILTPFFIRITLLFAA